MKKVLPLIVAGGFSLIFAVSFFGYFTTQPSLLTQEVDLCQELKNFEYVLEDELPDFGEENVLKVNNPEIMCDFRLQNGYQKEYLTLKLDRAGIIVTLTGITAEWRIHQASIYQGRPAFLYTPVEGAKKPGQNPVIVYHKNTGAIVLLGLLGSALFGLVGFVLEDLVTG